MNHSRARTANILIDWFLITSLLTIITDEAEKGSTAKKNFDFIQHNNKLCSKKCKSRKAKSQLEHILLIPNDLLLLIIDIDIKLLPCIETNAGAIVQ